MAKEYIVEFGRQIKWSAVVTNCNRNKSFELKIINAHNDWIDTKVGFSLVDKNGVTVIDFYHKGWQAKNEHYKISCYCWAMGLRILKRYLQAGEQVPYEKRLEV